MQRTRSRITNNKGSKKKTPKIPDSEDEVVIHNTRRGSLKALSDYESDYCSEGEKSESKGETYCSSDDSLVVVPKKRLKKTCVVSSENSDIDEHSLGHTSSQQLALRPLSDYETYEALSSSSDEVQRFKSKLSTAKGHAEADSDSEGEIIHFNRAFSRKRPRLIETETSDSDSQKPLAHILKKQKKNINKKINNAEENAIMQEHDLPSTSSSKVCRENHQSTSKTLKSSGNQKTVTKKTYFSSSSEDSFSSDSNSQLIAGPNAFIEPGSNDPCSSKTNCDEPPRPKTNNSVRQLIRQRIVQSDDSDDCVVTNSIRDHSKTTSIDNSSSSEDNAENLPAKPTSQRITRSSVSKERKQYFLSPSSEDSSDETRFSRFDNSRQPSTSTAHVANTSREESRAQTRNELLTRATRSAHLTNTWVNSCRRNSSTDYSTEYSEDSFDAFPRRISGPRLTSILYRQYDSVNNTTIEFLRSVSTNNFEQRSTRQLRPRRSQRNMRQSNLNSTSRYAPDTSDDSSDSSSDSDIQPTTSRYLQKKRYPIRGVSFSDHVSVITNDNENATPTTNRNASIGGERHDYSSDGDIQPKASRHGRRRVLTSDCTSSSDSEGIIASGTRRNGIKLKIEDSDDNQGEQNPDGKNTNGSSDSDNESEKCPICFDKFRLQEVGCPESCDHSFCAVCIQEWAKNSNTCPVDRKLFNSITIRTRYQGRVDRRVSIETPTRNPFEELFNVLTVLNDVGFVSSLEMVNFDSDDQVTFDSDGDGPEEICCVCNDDDGGEGDIIACDICNSIYHLGCIVPPLRHIPAGDWLCSQCRP